MKRDPQRPSRIHLLAHANPATKDIRRFGFADSAAMIKCVRESVSAGWRVTARRALLDAPEDVHRGGRRDDDARIKDIQGALDDPRTAAIIALNGGAYFSRILPHLDFTAIKTRPTPLVAMGFSEMTNFLNAIATHGGRAVYWLCPSYLAWKVKPQERARAAFAAFWSTIPSALESAKAGDLSDVLRAVCSEAHCTPPTCAGRILHGKPTTGIIRVIGGCLSVLVANLAGPLARRLRPNGRWLLIEDINEQEYRIDRFLAAIKLAGWFERISGVIIGDFHLGRECQRDSVAALLQYHLPRNRGTPILSLPTVGHTWPMQPLELHCHLRMLVRGREFELFPT